MKYKPYQEYEASEIEWIGDIPKGWILKKLRFLGELDSSGVDKKIREDELLYKSVHYMDVYRNKLSEIENNDDYLMISADDNKAKKCRLLKGDVLFTNSSETPDDIGQSTIIREDLHDTLYGYHLMRFRPKYKFYLEYEKYLFGYDMLKCWFELRANGITRYGINYVDFADALIHIPPFEEQKQIAKFLDRETRRITNIINLKIQLIEKLRERRKSIISNAVTKGLNSNAIMKPSEIDWIGDIPEGWMAVPLTKYLESIVDYRGKTPQKVNEGIFLVTAKNIKEGVIDYTLSQEFVNIDEYEEIMKRGIPSVGDVLFTTEAPLGEVANIDNANIALAQRVMKFRGKKLVLNNYFLKYWIMSSTFQNNLQSLATGSTALGIKASKLHMLRLTLPPLKEQIQIVDYIDVETKRIDTIIEKTQSTINKMKEYQIALISAAVTGEIDVRGEV